MSNQSKDSLLFRSGRTCQSTFASRPGLESIFFKGDPMYRKVDLRFARDAKIRKLDASGRHLAKELITSQYSHMCGCYYITSAMLADDTGMDAQTIEREIANLVEIGFCQYDPEHAIVWVPKMAHYQVENFNQKHMINFERHLKDLDGDLPVSALESLRKELRLISKGRDRVSDTVSDRVCHAREQRTVNREQLKDLKIEVFPKKEIPPQSANTLPVHPDNFQEQEIPEGFQEGLDKAFPEALPKGMPRGCKGDTNGTLKDRDASNVLATCKHSASKMLAADAERIPVDLPEENHIPYQDVLDLYNTMTKSLPKARVNTAKRRRAIRVLWRKLEDAGQDPIGKLKETFEGAERSNFLTGRNGGWSGCGFDWLININNMVKILEGNYDNNKRRN